MLCRDLAELRTWGNVAEAPVHVFCDASGADARLGVVVYADGLWHWTSTTVGERGLKHFRRRRDKQIMGLELLAISLAFGTFAPILRRRRVIVYCDNTGAEVSLHVSVGCGARGLLICVRLLSDVGPLSAGTTLSWSMHSELRWCANKWKY